MVFQKINLLWPCRRLKTMQIFFATIGFTCLFRWRYSGHCLWRHVNHCLRKHIILIFISHMQCALCLLVIQMSCSQRCYLANGVQRPHSSKVLCCLVWRFLAYCLCSKKKKDQWLSKQCASYIILQTKQHPAPLCVPQNKIWSPRTLNNFAVKGHCLLNSRIVVHAS